MITISQSFMKAMDEDKRRCPAKARAIYIDGIPTEPTEAMTRGNYFETLLLGSTDDGTIAQMERTSKGERSTAQIRVEANAKDAKYKLREEMKMDWQHPRMHIEQMVDIDGVLYKLRARTDMVTSFHHPERGYFPKVILDWKITDSIYADYGEFAWGNPAAMDLLQAKFYVYMHYLVFKEHIPFVYQVMDLSPKRNYKFVFVEVTKTGLNEALQAVRRTAALIEQYQKSEWPTLASHDNCPGCPLRSKCPKGHSGSRVQDIKL